MTTAEEILRLRLENDRLRKRVEMLERVREADFFHADCGAAGHEIVELLGMTNPILQDLIYKAVDGPPYDLASSGRRKTLLEVFRENTQ